MDLLEKASIILTPTAYNNGEALCVKPTDGSGDFDFSRNSAATRVNAQGLVENVQILSSNLVQNGDFSELGSEEVSNGSFSQEGVEIADASTITNAGGSIMTKVSALNYNATSDGTGASSIRPRLFFNDVTTGNFYRIRVSGTNQSGSVNFKLYDGNAYIVEDNDLTTDIDLYFEAKSTSVFIAFDGTNPFNVDFSISLKEVGQDWTFGTGWSVADGVASKIQSAASYLEQTLTIPLVQNKVYKITYTATIPDGNLRPELTGGGGTTEGTSQTTSGTYTDYIKAENNHIKFRFRANADFNGSVTNISVKEVAQNWTLGTGWSIDQVNNKATCDGTQTSTSTLRTTEGISNIQNALVKISFEIKDYSAGAATVTLEGTGGTDFSNVSANGIYEANVTSTDALPKLLFNANSSFVGSVTNVSIIEITDDTNLPRINYEGFSYQDALGSELVTNGDFATDTDWTKGSGWSIGNGVATTDGTINQSITQSNVTTIGKTYKYSFDVLNSGVGVIDARFRNGGGSVFNFSSEGTYTGTFVAYNTEAQFTTLSGNTASFSIDNVSVKEYLGQEVVPDSGCGSWLFEPQSTNLVPYSEDFTQDWLLSANGTGSIPVITPNDAVSPDGNTTADKVVLDMNGGTTSSNWSFITFPYTSTATTYTLTCYLKGINGGEEIFFDLDNGSDNLITLTNDWVRYEINKTVTTTTTRYIRIGLRGGKTTDDSASFHMWGAQLEEQNFATSLIPTSGTSVTRNQDVCNNGGSLASINSTEGVLYVEIAALADDLTNRYITISNGNNSYIRLTYTTTSNQLGARYYVNGSFQCALSHILTNETEFVKAAFKWKQDDFALWVNGVEVETDTSGNVNPDNTFYRLDFRRYDGLLPFFGKTKALAVWKEALSDEELTELTTI